MNKPLLSVILTGRNDNYGGDFIQRLQRCIDWNTRFLEAYGIYSEIIIVNWNPVPGNDPLMQLIRFPANRKHVKYRIITVPPEIHDSFIDPSVRKTVPVFEFIAKNAGIRRAAGEYILSINADVLIHPSVFKFISGRKTDKHHYYRTNRLDFTDAQATDVQSFYRSGLLASLKGFAYYFNPRISKRFQYHLFRGINKIRLAWEFWKLRNAKISDFLKLPVTYDNAAFIAHCHNSGDFMLMHKEYWLELRAYPEYTYLSTHTDAIFTIFAYQKLKEFVFSEPVFHQEHARRYSWEAIKNESPFLEAFQLFETNAKKLAAGMAVDSLLNNESWGLATFNLAEHEC